MTRLSFTMRARFAVPAVSVVLAIFLAVVERSHAFEPLASMGGVADFRFVLAQADAAPAETPPNVRLRTGEHKTHSRLVFDWPRKVGYRVVEQPGNITISFDQAAQWNTSRLSKRPARWITAIAARTAAGTSQVVLAVQPGVRVSHLRVGPKVVIDIFPPDERAEQGKQAKNVATPPSTTPPEPTKIRPARTKPAVPLLPAGSAEMASAVPSSEAAPAPVSPERSPIVESRSPAIDLGPPPAPTLAVEVLPTRPTAFSGHPFALPEAVRAVAAFERAGSLWLVLAGEYELDLDGLAVTLGVDHADEVVAAGATVVRLGAREDATIALHHDGARWFVLAPDSAGTSDERSVIVPQRIDKPALGPRLWLEVADPGQPVIVTDPGVRDTLVVVPVPPPVAAIAHDFAYAQLTLLRTLHGIAFAPRVDDVETRSLRRGVEIDVRSGLLLSDQPADPAASVAVIGEAGDQSRIVAPMEWLNPRTRGFSAERKRLIRAVVRATPQQIEDARFDLVRFYLNYGFGAEALGVLNLIAADREGVEAEQPFRFLRGIAQLLMARPDAAREDLEHPALDAVDEAVLWRGVLAVAENRADEAGAAMVAAGSMVVEYPAALRRFVLPALVEAALAAGDPEKAELFLDVMDATETERRALGRIALLRGRILAAAGDRDSAIAAFKAAQDSEDQPSRVRASVELIELALADGAITTADARAKLESLRFLWRGDGFEFALLQRLGNMHLHDGAYGPGLRALREAITLFPHRPEVAAITQRMAETFESLFLGEQGNDLPALRTIALFDEFRELTPAGGRGDEMIRRLADRLVGVDLLDRAGNLLDDQVRHRLTGKEKARVGARLALIRLFDRDAEGALAALNQSRAGPLSAELKTQRRHLRARALMDVGRAHDAIALLDGDDSHDALLIRAEIHWAARDWQQAEGALRKLGEGQGIRPHATLDEEQARYVLNRAVALTLGGDERALARLRDGYSDAMNATPYRDAFRLIAGEDVTAGEGVFAVVDRRLEEAEGFQAFLAVWRDRLRQQDLSGIN